MEPIALSPSGSVTEGPAIALAPLLVTAEMVAVAVLLSVLAAHVAGRARRVRALLVPLAALVPHLPGLALVALYHGCRGWIGWTWSGEPLVAALLILLGVAVSALLVWRRRNQDGSARPWAVAAGVLALITAITWHQATQASQVEGQILSARAGATLVALRPGMPAPGANAAVDLLHLSRVAEGVPEEIREAIRTGSATAGDVAAMAPVLAAAESASAKPVLAMPRDLLRPLSGMVLREVEPLILAGRSLEARSTQSAAAGDRAGAWDDIARIQRLAMLAGQEPLMVTQLVAGSIHARAFAAAATLAQTDPDPRPVAILPGWSWQQRMDQTLIVDEAWALQTVLDDPIQTFDLLSGTNHGMAPRLLWPAYRLLVLRRDVASYRDGLQRTRKALRDGLPGLVRIDGEGRGTGLVDGLLRSAVVLLARQMARADAEAVVMAAASAAMAHRRATGAWPPAPSADWPRDPCDGQPLRMRVEGGALVIWSVGPDGIDDGGRSGGTDRLAGDVALGFPAVR